MTGGFFRGNDVVLDEKFKALRTEFELALLKQKQQFDDDLDELERDLIARIELAEKTKGNNSLKAEPEKPEDVGELGKGYKSWTQRKASRLMQSADPSFPQKVLKRSQK